MAAAFTTIYRIPRTKLRSVQPDLESLDVFPCLQLDGVSSGFWPMLATRLNLGSPAKGAAVAVAQEGGLALYEWNPTFVTSFVRRVDPDLLEAVVYDLVRAEATPGLDLSMTQRAVGKLKGFLSKTDVTRDALVECAAF